MFSSANDNHRTSFLVRKKTTATMMNKVGTTSKRNATLNTGKTQQPSRCSSLSLCLCLERIGSIPLSHAFAHLFFLNTGIFSLRFLFLLTNRPFALLFSSRLSRRNVTRRLLLLLRLASEITKVTEQLLQAIANSDYETYK